MSRTRRFYGSTLGKKIVVAVTGIILVLFVLGHMIGNLKSFLGTNEEGVPDIDVYGHFLRTMGEPLFPYGTLLWIVRIILIVAFVLHVANTIQLARRNRAARPDRYAKHKHVQASLATRWQLWSGLFLLGYVVLHLLQFTFGWVEPSRFEAGQVYGNLYRNFELWFYPLIYVVAMFLLALHTYHGAWSFFQTLGIDNPDRNRGLRAIAALAAVILFVGFSAVPIFFYLGAMPAPPDPATLPPPYGGQ